MIYLYITTRYNGFTFKQTEVILRFVLLQAIKAIHPVLLMHIMELPWPRTDIC